MGRVPLLFLVFACAAISACTPETDSPDPQETRETKEAVRDAGQAARDAMKKAGDALRRLSGAGPDEPAPGAEAPVVADPTQDALPTAASPPMVEVPLIPDAPAEAPVSIIEPVPDETQQLEEEQHIQVERDASVATQEAKQRILEATRRAADRFRKAGEGMVEAFRPDEPASGAPGDTMGDTQPGAEATPGTSTPETPRPE